MTPYNTGRIKMYGTITHPCPVSDDQLNIQSALLAKPSTRPALWLWAVVYSACAVVIVFVVLGVL